MAHVQRVTAIRHAETNKAPPESGYQGDLVRTLTEPGRAQAVKRRSLLGAPTFDRVGSSPMLRARETAVLVGGLENADSLMLIDEIGVGDPATGGDAAAIDALFNQLGYKPLGEYLAADEALLMRYASAAWRGMQTSLLVPAKPDERLLVVGHAVLLPAAFYAGVERGSSVARELETLNLNAAGGFTIVWRDGDFFDFIERNEEL